MSKRTPKKVPKKPVGNLTNIGGPRGSVPAPSKVIDPSKLWPMDESDVKVATKYQQLTMVALRTLQESAHLRRDFIKKEKDYNMKLDLINTDQEAILNDIRKKHKIIGEIERFDFDKKQIVIK